MVELWWWYDGDPYHAVVTLDALRYLYELLTIYGAIPDDMQHIYCVMNDRKVDPQAMMNIMERW